jgi:hypothetical protein
MIGVKENKNIGEIPAKAGTVLPEPDLVLVYTEHQLYD